MIASLKRFIIGKPLMTDQLNDEKLPPWKALPILSSDALSSIAYGTENLVKVLALVSTSAAVLWMSLPITAAIIGLLILLILSYRQIIYQYPSGGGAYIVSYDNLGKFFGLIAGGSLLVDYTLTVAVSVSASSAAITSAFPLLKHHDIFIAIFLILIVMTLNLRGAKESGNIFALPTYLFIFSIFMLIISGVYTLLFKNIYYHVNDTANAIPSSLTLFIILKAFSSGCTALTGVEAISNATPNFKNPTSKNCAKTLTILGILLASMFGGISFLTYMFGIIPNSSETVLSQLSETIFGRTVPYYLVQSSTALILMLAANTSFSGFPLLAAIMSKDKYMPRIFSTRGDRLNFSNGIILLALASISLIIAFEGDIDKLIPLYAMGVFLSFTLAQTGMVVRWAKIKTKGWKLKLILNALGALVTFSVLLIFAVTKFSEGAWIVTVVIPILIFLFSKIHSHYTSIAKQLKLDKGSEKIVKKSPIIVLPIGGINKVVANTISYAKSINVETVAFFVGFDHETIDKTKLKWDEWNTGIPLIIKFSKYRSLINPLMKFIDKIKKENPNCFITVLIPEFIPAKWWHRLLHNQTALILRILLFSRKDVTISTVPFRLTK